MTEGDRSRDDEEVADDAEPEDDERPDHLDDLADGCGCAEVWESLSEYRQESD